MRHVLGLAVVTGLLLALPATAIAVGDGGEGSSGALPFYDSRAQARADVRPSTGLARGVRVSERTREARSAALEALGPEASLTVDPLTGTPRQLIRTDGALSGPSDRGAVAAATDYLRDNRVMLGLSEADLAALDLYQHASTTRGLTVVRFRQLVDGIPAFDNDVRLALDAAGRVYSVGGSPVHDPSVATTEPRLSGADALAALARSVGSQRSPEVRSGPAGRRQTTTFAGGDFARLVLFGAGQRMQLGWHVTLHASSTALYDAVVDAGSGAVLYRANLVKDVANADVYENHPGAAPPVTVDLEDYGLNPGATTLDGSWARTWSDLDDDDVADPAEEVPPSGGSDFLYPFTPFTPGNPDCAAPNQCAWNPAVRTSWQTNREQDAVQAFYLVSRFHDHLAGPDVLFTDEWGNFEVGGTGGDDPVLVNADDGAAAGPGGGPDVNHSNNANMSTPPDGIPPRMQMYLFEDSGDPFVADFRNVNGGDDSGVVWHEYTHGLSNRLVTNADGSGALNTAHAGAMGEAWSDWFASDLQVLDGLKTNTIGDPGEIDIGEYTDLDPGALRTQALDCPADVVDTACPGGAETGVGGYTLGDFGHVFGLPEVHADGEIWAETLWDLREALEIRFGDDVLASQLAEILVSDGMRLSPPEPTMLDMRNAILAADQIDFGAFLHELIWDVFRKRGMGYFAAATDGSDTRPAEDFSPPPDADGPQGTVTGVVSDDNSGLPLAGVRVGFGGHSTDPAFGDYLVDVTDAQGRYTIEGVPAGNYPKLAFFPGAGYDPVVARNVSVTGDETTQRDASMRRDWAALSGGATVESVSDDTGAPFGCGAAQAFDQSQGTGWSPFNPNSDDPGNPHAGPPTVVLQLPETIDVTSFLVDPSATCGDGPSATTREFSIETSADGTSYQLAYDGTGPNEFTDANIGLLNELHPTGTTGAEVRFIRITLLSPLRVDPACDPNPCSGTDFIDLSEFVILGGAPNTLPAGSLAIDKTRARPGETVHFDASSFADPDSRITGYDWDFDGDGTTDRSTQGPTTDFVFANEGTFTARVSVNDFRGGAGTATQAIEVRAPRAPVITLPDRGDGHSVVIKVSCSEPPCQVSGKLKLSDKLAKRLDFDKSAIAEFDSRVDTVQETSITVDVPQRVINRVRGAGLDHVKVKTKATATDVNSASTSAKRKAKVDV